MQTLTFDELATRYCERQECTPDNLKSILRTQKATFQPVGWMLLECQMLDSSLLGSLTIIPYGPNSTFKESPTGPISPRGLASDMSIVVGILMASALPE